MPRRSSTRGDTASIDYYEVLQISPNAEPETIQRVYRLLAQRYHPDNQDTGNANYFRIIREGLLGPEQSRLSGGVRRRPWATAAGSLEVRMINDN